MARLPPTLVAPQGRAGRRSPTTRVGEKTGEATNSPRQDPHQAAEAAPKGAGRPPGHQPKSKADHYLSAQRLLPRPARCGFTASAVSVRELVSFSADLLIRPISADSAIDDHRSFGLPTRDPRQPTARRGHGVTKRRCVFAAAEVHNCASGNARRSSAMNITGRRCQPLSADQCEKDKFGWGASRL